MNRNKILRVLAITPAMIAAYAGVTKQAVSHVLKTGTDRGKVPGAITELIAAARMDIKKIEAAQATRAAINEFLGE